MRCEKKVSNEPFANVTVASLVSIEYKMPSYLISDLEIRLILVPRYGVPEVISRHWKDKRKNTRMAQDGQDYSLYFRFCSAKMAEQLFFSSKKCGKNDVTLRSRGWGTKQPRF